MSTTDSAPRRGFRPRLRRATAAISVLLVALLLTACGSDRIEAVFDTDDMSVDPAEPMLEFDDGWAGEAEMAERGFADDLSMPVPPPSGAPTGEHVIRTAFLVLESEDTAAALEEVRSVAERFDGYAATSDLSRDVDGVVTGRITLRVPSGRLGDVVEALEAIGEAVPTSRVDELDVTMEMTDIRARIENLTVYETELQALLGEIRESSTDAEGLLRVFERIREVRQEIEMLQARSAALADQVAMATVDVHIEQLSPQASAGDVVWDPGDTLRESFAATAAALALIADAAIWIVVTALPVTAVVLALPALAIWWILRQRARREPHA